MFSNALPVAILNYAGSSAMEPFLSPDGATLFWNNSNAPGTDTNLFRAQKITDQAFWNLGPVGGVNTPALDAVASMDLLHNFYFVSSRNYAAPTLNTLYRGTYNNGSVSGVAAVSGVSLGIPGWITMDAQISADGATLYFVDALFLNGSPGPSASIMRMAQKQWDGSFARLANSDVLLASVNAAGLNYAPSIATDGLTLFWTRASGGMAQIMASHRASLADPFGPAMLISAPDEFVEGPCISFDGSKLYYHKRMPDGSYALQMRTG